MSYRRTYKMCGSNKTSDESFARFIAVDESVAGRRRFSESISHVGDNAIVYDFIFFHDIPTFIWIVLCVIIPRIGTVFDNNVTRYGVASIGDTGFSHPRPVKTIIIIT